ncbi:MAG: hypothetical protein E6K94_04595 [Thaumarchaeota archaeon]|nr:MAG: hypothetical protein E6K94_04595 [Nitrososphaerota archaeon]
MKISDMASILKEKLPEISDQVAKLADNTEYQEIFLKAGAIGGIINLGINLFKKIRNSLKTEEEIHYAAFIQLVCESAKQSIPSNLMDISLTEMEVHDIFGTFSENFGKNYYHLPDHPAVRKFRGIVIEKMKEQHHESEIQKFIVNLNSKIIIKAKVSGLINTHLANSKLKSLADNLIKYLEFLTTQLDQPNPVDNTPVSKYYLESQKIVIDSKSWQLNAVNLLASNYELWEIDDFLHSDKKREFVASEFGNGKTNFLKKVAADYAMKYLTGEDSYVPIFVPLKRKLNNIFGDENLEDILKLAEGQNILLLCDALDEYDDDIKTLIYEKLPNILVKHNNVKIVFTTRLEPDIPKSLNFLDDKYVRLLPFDTDQVNEFFSESKYNLPNITYNSLKEYGLEQSEISKPLLCWMFAVMHNTSNNQLNIKSVSDINIKRVLFFQEVIHSIIVGKHRTSSSSYDLESLYKEEKRMLRNIAYLNFQYKENLNTKTISEKLTIQEKDILTNPIITTYFNLITTSDRPKKK